MTPRTETPDIYEDLRTKLVTAQFVPGMKLKPTILRKLYGCSANTVRETLFRLAAVGLVSFEDQRGFWVRPVSQQRRHDLTTFRITLEQQGAMQSIKNGGIEWEARLTAAHYKLSHIEDRITKAGDVVPFLIPWCAAEWEFHETLISACDSPILRETFRSVYDQFRQQLITKERNYGYFNGNISEHERIVAAAIAGDRDSLCENVHDHLSRNLIDAQITG